jgi:hypothetical protein
MTTPVRSPRLVAALLLPAAFLLLSAPAAAQQATDAGPGMASGIEDPRWLPWVGCWEPTDQAGPPNVAPATDPADPDALAPEAAGGSSLLVCVTPSEGGVDIETLIDGESMLVEHFRTDGTPQPAMEGGCEGTRQATWSDDGRRVYLSSDLVCGADARRTTSGVFAMGADGFDWIEIQAIGTVIAGEADDDPYLSVRRFQVASRATLARHDRMMPAADRGLAVETSRRAAARALSTDAVVEAADRAGPEVAAALVAEMGYPFDLDARALKALSDQGVDAQVLDMMIAMTWPEHFQLAYDGSVARYQAPVERYDAPAARYGTRGYGYGIGCTGPFGRCSSFDLWMAYGYYGYGYYGYGLPYYGAPRGWYAGSRYVVVGPGTITRGAGGTMTSDGYRPPSGGTSTARPAVQRGGAQGSGQAAPARPAASTGSSGSAAPPPERRPAQRRTGGGGGGI